MFINKTFIGSLTLSRSHRGNKLAHEVIFFDDLVVVVVRDKLCYASETFESVLRVGFFTLQPSDLTFTFLQT